MRRAVEHWNRGEAELMIEMLDPELEIHSPFSSIAGEPYRGIPGYRQWISDITDQFEEWVMRLDQFRDLGDDRVFMIGGVHVRGRGSGVEFDQPAAGFVDFRDGRLLRLSIYLSEAEALQAAGL